jgi:hypothetical protein
MRELLLTLTVLMSSAPLWHSMRLHAEEPVATRKLWDDAFRKKRAATHEGEKAESEGESYLGITIWRLRSSAPQDAAAGSAEAIKEPADWPAARVEAGTLFKPGERIRLGIESARRGHLYVLDSEQYADGSRGETRMIFPTMRTRGGDNRVAPGRLIEIPDLADTPPYVSLKRSRDDHVADVVTILVTPRPIQGVALGREPQPVTTEQLARWERDFGSAASRLELPQGAGQPRTTAEREAASSPTRRLTHDDPLPQTLYRIDKLSPKGMLIEVSLSMSAAKTP